MEDSTIPIYQNFKKQIDWVMGNYEDAGITFSNGFQKDAIQNSVGARKIDRFKNFSCGISIKKNACGTFVIVEDSGTVGLTGRNITHTELSSFVEREGTLPSEERLARFTSMYNSGDNQTGGGLYGAGKSVYSAASTIYKYYFDSLREDGKYVANINDCGKVMPLSKEGQDAKRFIFDKTGFKEKRTVGTRIIIEKPLPELLDSIESGEIIRFIQESWWLILNRFENDSNISVNGMPIAVPNNIKNGTHSFELKEPVFIDSGFRVKHFGLYVFEKGDNDWDGISYYRKGMKIGEIDLKDVPDKIAGKYWGYIEVDKEWEEALIEIENRLHFGVRKGKKMTKTYQLMKNFCQTRARANFINWGFIKDKENENKKLNDELKDIAEDLQDLFDRLNFEDLGKGPQKSNFDVRWQDIKFPVYGSEKVSTDDTIYFSARIKSSYLTNKKLEYCVYTTDPKTNRVIHEIKKDIIMIASNSTERLDFMHTVTERNSNQYGENKIVLDINVIGSGKKKTKHFSYFYDIDKPDNHRDNVKLFLHSCTMPHDKSRRINFGDSLKDISYLLENKRNYSLKYRINVSIHNGEDPTHPKIMDVYSFSGEAKPYEEIITEEIPEILIDPYIFKQHLSEGIVELRARVIAVEDDEEYEKGDKITFYHHKLYLNCDENNGKKDSFNIKSVEAPDNYKRSWLDTGEERTICVNVGHTSYLSVKEYPDIQHEYLREQMLKQYVRLYLLEGKYDVFNEVLIEFRDMDPSEAADKVIDKIEWVYNQSLN